MTTNKFVEKDTKGNLILVTQVADKRELEEDEYYAMMVTATPKSWQTKNELLRDYQKSGYNVNLNPIFDTIDVGIEKTSGEYGWYVSKKKGSNYTRRGRLLIVKVVDINKCCILESR
jgi:hypothetical protein